MARPIRDFPTETARPGDASRAYGRFDDGLNWVQSGMNALERAGAEIGRVIAERVEKTNRLEDATARSEGLERLRLDLDSRIRGLDPRSPDYANEVERAFSETLDRVVAGTNWRSSTTREMFMLDARQLRTQVMLNAAERREQAVERAALQQIETVRARTVAAIAQTPGARDILLLQFENEVGPILNDIRPEKRDEILRLVRGETAETAVRALIDARNFGAAEQALRAYGGQGLLSPTAVRQLRSGLETEKRQAAAEARAATALAVENVRSLLRVGLLEDGKRTLDEAVKSGVIRQGSEQERILRALVAAEEHERRDRTAENFLRAVATIDNFPLSVGGGGGGGGGGDGVGGLGWAERALQGFFTQQEVKAELARLGPEPNNVNSDQIELRARQVGQERAIAFMLDHRPHDLPNLLENMVKGAANDPRLRGRVGEFLNRLRDVHPWAVEQVLRKDPALAVVLDNMRALNEPITASTVAGRLSGENLVPRTEEEWNKLTTRTQTRAPAIDPWADVTQALKNIVNDSQLRRQIENSEQLKAVLLNDYKRAWQVGYERTKAAEFAVNRALANFEYNRASTQPRWLPRENVPVTYFRRDLFDGLIKPDVFERRVVESIYEAIVKSRAAKGETITVDQLRREIDIFVTATPVTVGGEQRAALVAHWQHKRPGAPVRVLMAENNQPWLWVIPTGDKEQVENEFDKAFGLRAVLNALRADPGRTYEQIRVQEMINARRIEAQERFAPFNLAFERWLHGSRLSSSGQSRPSEDLVKQTRDMLESTQRLIEEVLAQAQNHQLEGQRPAREALNEVQNALNNLQNLSQMRPATARGVLTSAKNAAQNALERARRLEEQLNQEVGRIRTDNSERREAEGG
jgi:hypothetical protein